MPVIPALCSEHSSHLTNNICCSVVKAQHNNCICSPQTALCGCVCVFMLHSQQETHCGEQRVRPCQAWHVHWINGVCVCVSEGVQPQNVYKLQEAKKKKKDQDASSSFQDKHLFKYMMRSRTVVLITAWCHSYQNKTETKRQTDQLILICTNYDSGFPHQWCHQSTAYCKCIFIMGPARNKTSVLEYS